jgi:hypothetical protein
MLDARRQSHGQQRHPFNARQLGTCAIGRSRPPHRVEKFRRPGTLPPPKSVPSLASALVK